MGLETSDIHTYLFRKIELQANEFPRQLSKDIGKINPFKLTTL